VARKLYRLGLFTAHHRWIVTAAWIAAVIVLAASFRAVGGNTSNNLKLPGTDSQAATDLLAERFPPQQNGSNPIVFHTRDGKVTAAANEAAIKRSHQAIKALQHVSSAPSPFGQKHAAQISKDERTAFIPVLLDVGSAELTEQIASSVVDAAAPAREAGMEVAAGGSIGSELSEPETESSEVVGLTVAMVILAFTFGTLVAMGMPIASAIVGLVAGLSLIGLLANVVTVPSIGPTLATMIGLGVGIDYALFLVSRYRSERAEGRPTDEAVAIAVATSGTAILFAGSTVVIALVTLFIAGIPLVTSLGYSAAFAVVTAALAAITWLPALLSIAGRHIDSLRVPAFLRPAAKPPGAGAWAAWGRFVTSHPWRCIALTMAVLLPLIVPVFSLELGQEDVGATPKSTTERKAYDLMASGFGVGYNGPLIVAVAVKPPAKADPEVVQQEKQAKSLQAKLESEQQQGEAEAAELQDEADALEAQQDSLEAEQAALEAQGAALGVERAELERQRDELATRRTLRQQLSELVAGAKPIARRTAKLSAREAALNARLGALREIEQRIRDRLAQADTPRERDRLQRRLARVRSRETQLQAELSRVRGAQSANERRARKVARQASRLRAEAQALGEQGKALASAAGAAALEAFTLGQSKQQLEQQAAEAQVQAANLQTQQAELETEQQKAKGQQKQAEQLQDELTKELTRAGGDKQATDPRLVKLQKGLNRTPGVDLVSPPQLNQPGDAAVFTVIPTTAPAATATADLVTTFRDYVIPQSTAGTDVKAHVGGSTASYVDLAAGISDRLLLVIAAVVGLGFIVLTTAFRSIIVSAQAAIANVLSVTAAFGIVTLCFQEGWGIGLVGLDTASGTDPIASFVPLIMFAVLFGLSMDYQVFLMTQIEQHRARAADDREAIADGLAAGGKVIAAAALIMISVFASFILNGDPTVKQFGVGLSVGVALAALTVLALAPAILVLAGRGSWWVPAWADRWLPHVEIEGAHLAESGESGARGGR
jgi:uncharacterized membrane protein YdfJ with MMPL/SSD domain